MSCVRCEISRAKLIAIVFSNLGFTAQEVASHLTKRYEGTYFVVHNEHGKGVMRRNNNPDAPSIPIWMFE